MSKIFIVDDDQTYLGMFSTALTRAGHSVMGHFDSTESIEKIRIACPDLIVLDIKMPGINGIQLLSSIKKCEDICNIPVAMVSSDLEENDIKTCKELGAIDCIRKGSAYEMIAEINRVILFKLQKNEKINHKESINHSITFDHMYYQAGLDILSYFGSVVHEKYPDIPVKITIAQEDLTVSMTIETTEGHKTKIEETLYEYGLVLSKNMLPEHFMPSQLSAIKLEHKMEMISMELRHTRDILNQERDSYKQRIGSLESEVHHLCSLIGKSLLLQEDAFVTRVAPTLSQTTNEQKYPTFPAQTSLVSPAYHVFLCHNNHDKPAVKDIARQLQQRGLRPWLDEWVLRPGDDWLTVLEQQIVTIPVAAVFIGPYGDGPWQIREYHALLHEYVKKGCRVIPVILSGYQGSPQLPPFLQTFHCVDFRQSYPSPLEALVRGIHG